MFQARYVAPEEPSLIRGLGMGLSLGFIGALVWVFIGRVTGLSVGLVAAAIGYSVGAIVAAVSGRRSTGVAATAAGIAFVSALTGDIGLILANTVARLHIPLSALLEIVGPMAVLKSVSGLSWAFCLLAGVTAFRTFAKTAQQIATPPAPVWPPPQPIAPIPASAPGQPVWGARFIPPSTSSEPWTWSAPEGK
ncbi:MAG: hypothetical protein ABI912_04255 [Actinomycetota bacterium]